MNNNKSTEKHPPASLYVGDLSPNVTEAVLFELFSKASVNVASIRICRYNTFASKRSSGYAYVNFHDAHDAERALEILNYSIIHGKCCRIMWQIRDPTLRKSGVGNVFIKKLPPTIGPKDLSDAFSPFGNILSTKISTDEHGKSKGFGFVHFATEESAKNAIEAYRRGEIPLSNEPISPDSISPFIPKKDRHWTWTNVFAQHSYTNVFVKGLDPSVTQEELRQNFEQFGKVVNAQVVKDSEGVSRGFGFVNYEDSSSAEEAIRGKNDTELKGQKLWVGRPWNNVFVKGLHPSITSEELKKDFERFGTVTSAVVMTDPQGQSRGFGFVNYEDPQSAEQAANQMNEKKIKENQLWCARSTWTNVFVKGLHPSITSEELKQIFEPYGKITSAVVMLDQQKQSRGFGFVNYEDPQCAETATKEMHEKVVKEQKLWCGRAQKKTERQRELEKYYKALKGTNLYLKNFEDDLTEDKLTQFFVDANCGDIKNVSISKNRGFGFISFHTPNAASHAISAMNGRALPNSRKPLYVAYHEPKHIRERKLAIRYANRYKPRPGAMPSVYPSPTVFYPSNQAPYLFPQQQMSRRTTAWGAPPFPLSSTFPPNYPNFPPRKNPPRSISNQNQSQKQQQQLQQPPQNQPASRPQQQQQQQQQLRKVPTIPSESGDIPLTMSTLLKFPEEQQRLLLGERLYPIIQKTQPRLAGKITGMLLDSGWKIDDLLTLLYDEEKLNEKVADAAAILGKVNTTTNPN